MGDFVVSSGVTVHDLDIGPLETYQDLTVSGGGAAVDTQVHEFGGVFISSGGTTTGTVLLAASLPLSTRTSTQGAWRPAHGSNAWARKTSPEAASRSARRSARAAFKAVNGVGDLRGTASGTIISQGGTQYVESHGDTVDTIVLGSSFVSAVARRPAPWCRPAAVRASPGTASAMTVSSGGLLHVDSNGVAIDTTVHEFGTVNIENGGTTTGTVLLAAAEPGDLFETVSAGGTAIGTQVQSLTQELVNVGGVAIDTQVSSGGNQGVAGTASGVTVSQGGTSTSAVPVSRQARLSFLAAPRT